MGAGADGQHRQESRQTRQEDRPKGLLLFFDHVSRYLFYGVHRKTELCSFFFYSAKRVA